MVVLGLYLFDCSSLPCIQQGAGFNIGDGSDNYFGRSLASSGSNLVVVGAPGYSSSEGAGFFYQITDTSTTTTPAAAPTTTPASSTTTTAAAAPTTTTTAAAVATSKVFGPCPAGVYDHATWKATAAGQNATGLCDAGFLSTSQLTRLCSADGFWSPQINNHCIGLFVFSPSPFALCAFF